MIGKFKDILKTKEKDNKEYRDFPFSLFKVLILSEHWEIYKWAKKKTDTKDQIAVSTMKL